MSRPAELRILCEDLQQQVFARHCAIALGFRPERIRLCLLPRGSGAGEQHVRDRYAQEVEAYRVRQARREAALIVAIDADVGSVAQRHKSLAAALATAAIAARGADERVALLVPRRNIETWIHGLDGALVDEQSVYPRLTGREADCNPAAVAMAEIVRGQRSPPPSLPSVATAAAELTRL